MFKIWESRRITSKLRACFFPSEPLDAIIYRFRSNVISADGIRRNLAAKPLSHALQTPESNMNYLTRTSQRVGAVAKPSDGRLIFANDMSGKSVSGKNLPTKYVDVSEVSDYSCSFKETESDGAIGTVFANWRDKNAGEYHRVSVGSGDPEYELDEIFSSEKAALAAANAKFKRVAKSNKTLSFTTFGRPDFFAESPIVFRGFSSKIPTDWIISRVEHTMNASGFVTSVECASLV
jgi:phage protein D